MKLIKKRAFTLIELLVVIAIIAVLMAILMPALRSARDQGRRVHCMSNVRSLAVAWLMYQDDNDNVLVNGNVPRSAQFKKLNEAFWVEPPQGPLGSYTGDPNPTLEEELRGIEQGALYPYVKDVDAYRCPSDDRKRNPDRATFRSFSIAGGMNGEERYNYTKRAIRKYTEIRAPGLYILREIAGATPCQSGTVTEAVSAGPTAAQKCIDGWMNAPSKWLKSLLKKEVGVQLILAIQISNSCRWAIS